MLMTYVANKMTGGVRNAENSGDMSHNLSSQKHFQRWLLLLVP